MLRRVLGPKREEVTGGYRRLCNKGFHNLYASLNFIRVIKSRRIRWARRLARMETKRNGYSILVGKPEGKRSLERSKSK